MFQELDIKAALCDRTIGKCFSGHEHVVVNTPKVTLSQLENNELFSCLIWTVWYQWIRPPKWLVVTVGFMCTSSIFRCQAFSKHHLLTPNRFGHLQLWHSWGQAGTRAVGFVFMCVRINALRLSAVRETGVNMNVCLLLQPEQMNSPGIRSVVFYL